MLDKDIFLTKYSIDKGEFEKLNINWDELVSIYADFKQNRSRLETSMLYLQAQLGGFRKVHSVRGRVKDAEHLIEKIIRKRQSNPNRIITIKNYREQITDLVGLRVLHLFKEDWVQIHEEIKSCWHLHENATANIRQGDSNEYIAQFRKEGLEVKYHDAGYRSIHYLVAFNPQKETVIAEIQVRTIFEEAWSEIDHCTRYPYAINDKAIGGLLLIFNRLVGSADELGSYIKKLSEEKVQSASEKANERDYVNSMKAEIEELKKQVDLLTIKKQQKAEMHRKIDNITNTYEEFDRKRAIIPAHVDGSSDVSSEAIEDFIRIVNSKKISRG